MDTHISEPRPSEAGGLDHYRAARWDDALRDLGKLRDEGLSTPELDELYDDILLKQAFERRMAPVSASAPRMRRLSPGALMAGGALMVTLLIGGLAASLLFSGGSSAAPAQRMAVVGALPTPAPTATPIPPPPPPTGQIMVEAAEGGQLTNAADNIYLIYDASGSMLASLAGQRKVDIARQAVGELITVLPEEARVALRTYGRNRPDDCSDVELVGPLAPLDRAALAGQVNAIEPVNLGRTPIGRSLEQVPADLQGASGDTLVLLLSDGEESCDGDPVGVAARLHAENPRLRISVIGFAVDEAAQARLAEIARAGGGGFFAADDVEQLAGALRQAVVPVYRVFDASGAEVARADLGAPVSLPPGRYSVSIGEVTPIQLDEVRVRGGADTVIQVREDAGDLMAEVVEAP